MGFRIAHVGALVALFSIAGTQAASAQPPSVEALRARLSGIAASDAIPEGALTTVAYWLEQAELTARRYPDAPARYRRRATDALDRLEAGADPLTSDALGKIVQRGYRSALSSRLQGYAIYVPEDYDPSRAYPLYVALHGGSSNGNLFLGVVLGNNVEWAAYRERLHDDFRPRWSPDWIVVAPTGFGQLLWRWFGEEDVLDVIDDVMRHYHVDADRVTLGGLSNGGIGAYTIGSRHAWRFASVQAMAGAPSWLQYAASRFMPTERENLARYSAMSLIENTVNTRFEYFHGESDGGPMRPDYVRAFSRRMRAAGLPNNETWFDAGHDILYYVHRHGRAYQRLAERRRDPSPTAVTVATGDYRAARQHWLEVTRTVNYPALAEARATVEGHTVEVTTDGVRAFALDLRTLPETGERLVVRVDGHEAYSGPRGIFGQRVHFVVDARGARPGFPRDPADHPVKRPGLSGPINDALHEPLVHVYGTLNEADTEALREAAERGARGWPLWGWDISQRVVADRDLDEETMRTHHVVLYATPGSHRVLERIAAQLPIRIDENGIAIGERRYDGGDVGTRFIYPNPLAPDRYVIVQAAPDAGTVKQGNRIPEFLPDYIVYDGRTVGRAQGRVAGHRNPARVLGFFDDDWQLREATDGAGDEDESERPESTLPIPPTPPDPAPRTEFGRYRWDPAIREARRIARRVPTFHNFRAEIRGARWQVDPEAIWQIRRRRDCIRHLRELGVRFRVPEEEFETPIPAPVQVVGRVGGVRYVSVHRDRPFVIACEMAARLPALSAILARRGVDRVHIMSSYRDHPRPSFHTMGLGVDMSAFRRGGTLIRVRDHFQLTIDQRTCEGPDPATPEASFLRALACEIADSHVFSSVLTPNYNEGHDDHFHLDARPDDPRFFVR